MKSVVLAAIGWLGCAAACLAAADKPLVIENAQVKQLPAGTTLQTQAPTPANASINLPHGTAPSSPNDGDCWTTTAGLYCRIDGSTVGPMGAAAPPGGSNGQIEYDNAGAFGGFTLSGDCSLTVPNITCTRTNGAPFSYFATGTSAANLTGTAPCGALPALTGDVTTSGCAATLATSGITAGTYGDGTHVGKFTVDAKGRVTSAANVAITGGGGSGGLTQLAQVTTTAGQSSVTLMGAIPQTYTNLYVSMFGGSVSSDATSSDTFGLQFNGDTGSHYYWVGIGAYNSAAFASGSTSSTSLGAGILTCTAAAGVPPGFSNIEIPNYTQANSPQAVIFQTTGVQSNVGILAQAGGGQWNPSTKAAITSIVVLNVQGRAFSTGTVITLYGQ
jgi:hypothetical protein